MPPARIQPDLEAYLQAVAPEVIKSQGNHYATIGLTATTEVNVYSRSNGGACMDVLSTGWGAKKKVDGLLSRLESFK